MKQHRIFGSRLRQERLLMSRSFPPFSLCASLFSLCSLWLGLCGSSRAAEHQILLTPAMITNESGFGDASLLVDEQSSVGDPAAGRGLAPKHPFFPGWTAWYYPVSVLIDLGAADHVSRVFFYNTSGQNEITVSTGGPALWKPRKITLGVYQNWQECRLDTATRYLRITLPQPISLPEIVVYGDHLGIPAPLPPAQRHIFPVMQSFLGVNAFIDDPIDKIAVPAGFVREYHNWEWDVENSDRQLRFQPSAAGGGWLFDDYYRQLKESRMTVSPDLQQTVADFFSGGDSDGKPTVKGKNAEEPASYARRAAYLFQYAARYGSRPVPDAAITLAPGQPRRSGQGLLRYLEDWNEPDKTWRGREGYFTPYELAAQLSADYDGDQERLGKTYGVKNADPEMRLVMGGLAGLNLNYLRAIKLWADVHRGGSFPADVLNLHHYSSHSGDQGFQPGGQGISPEADHLKEKVAAVAAWRDQALPGKELWVTEFGYDTNPQSPLHAPAIGTLSAEQVQGAWLVRSDLALVAAGVDRAAMFMLRDVKSDGAGVFETCGLVTEKGRWEPKPSWFYMAALKHHLTNTRYAGEVASGRSDVRIYRFDALTGSGRAYAVWCPTSEDKHISAYPFPLPVRSVSAVTLTAGKLEGESRPLPVRQGRITLEVSEIPLLLLAP